MAIIRKRYARYATASGDISNHDVELRGDIVFSFMVGTVQVYLSQKELRETIEEWREIAKKFSIDLETL